MMGYMFWINNTDKIGLFSVLLAMLILFWILKYRNASTVLLICTMVGLQVMLGIIKEPKNYIPKKEIKNGACFSVGGTVLFVQRKGWNEYLIRDGQTGDEKVVKNLKDVLIRGKIKKVPCD